MRMFRDALILPLAILVVTSVGFDASAHNGAVASAVPINNITIDGDLSDWPESMWQYQITKVDCGRQPGSAEDLSGHFRVGYDESKQMLYVAVKVTDESLTMRRAPAGAWMEDGCSIYVDRHRLNDGFHVEQYFQCGKDLQRHGAAQEWAGAASAKLVVGQTGNQRIYEWQIPLDEDAGPGQTLGFDVDITDKDEDGSFTWMAWGKGTQKVHFPSRIGHLHLIANGEQMELAHVEGQVRLQTSTGTEKPQYPFVSIQSTTIPSRRAVVPTDEAGRYSAVLPAGTYRISAVDSKELRVDESVKVECEAFSGRPTKAKVLIVPPPKGPQLIGELGLLQRKFDSKKVDEFVAAYQQFHHVPGVSLAIIHDGEIRYCQAYGVKNSATREPVVEDTLFEACSLTKPVFALAVNRLVEKGVLDLKRPLAEYLGVVPGYEDVVQDERYKKITAQHVLAHRTGFPNWRTGKLTIDFEPGMQYGYSGEGFEMLGAVVSHLTAKDLVSVMEEEVFRPFGIQNAHLRWNRILEQRSANGHVFGMSPLAKTRNEEPGMAYSLNIDARNYAKLLASILRREGMQLETYANMLSQQFEISNPNNPFEFPYGLGVIVEQTPFGKKFSHTGVNPGWRCRFAIYDDLNMGYVVFTNSDRGDHFGDDLERFLVTGIESADEFK